MLIIGFIIMIIALFIISTVCTLLFINWRNKHR